VSDNSCTTCLYRGEDCKDFGCPGYVEDPEVAAKARADWEDLKADIEREGGLK